MPRVAANGIEVEFDTFGSSEAPPLLLIMGLGQQMIQWDEAFCQELARGPHFVIRFDNRDVGKSTWMHDAGVPNVLEVFHKIAAREPVKVPYLLADMAADTAGLLDALGIESAHVVGSSMGGMIAQTLSIREPQRVRTLTSIQSTTGAPDLPGPSDEVLQQVMRPPAFEREAAVEQGVQMWRTIGSPGFPFDEARTREKVATAFDRGFNPAGGARQLAAIAASGSRRDALRNVQRPCLVIHGREDALVPLAGGEDTARAVPGAGLHVVEGMGHDLPRGAWPEVTAAILGLTTKH